MRYQRPELPLKLHGFDAARDFFAGCLAETNSDRDTLWVAHVDEQSRCLHLSNHEGAAGASALPIAKILADAAAHHSAGIVLAQRSGCPQPTRHDCAITKRLAAAAEVLDCTVLDHLLFTGGHCTSLRKLGCL
ncbi:MAG TPA: JAB domain-containing protein [Sphingomicrobium sp.]|nr:JAB domain-containing protein [Sphingomicrobium sp.]